MKRILFLMSLASFVVAAPAPAPTGTWSFDEGSGTNVGDSSGSGLNGVTTAAWGPGKVGKAVVLSGTNKHFVKLSVPKDKQPGKGSFTIACWIQPTTFDIESKQKQRRFFGFDKWPWFFVVGDLLGDGRVNVSGGYKADSNSQALNSSCNSQKAIALGQWTHVALVCDREAGKLRIFLNGLLDAEATPSKEWLDKADLSGDQPFTVGSSWQSFAGSVDELKYWKKPLGPEEIKALAGVK